MIYITGANRGLGRELFQELKDYHNLRALNRTSGYDLDKDLDAFVKDDFSVYINNAQSGFQQTELLYKLFEKNKDRVCHIVNIGSVSGDGDRKEVNRYAVEKSSLEKATTQLQLISDAKCKVSLVKLGRMRTEMVDHIQAAKMDTGAVARLICESVIDPHSLWGMYVKSITIDNI